MTRQGHEGALRQRRPPPPGGGDARFAPFSSGRTRCGRDARFVPLTASAGRDNRSRDGDRTSSKVAEATATFDYTDNMQPIGYSARKVPIDNFRPRQGTFNSDLAFWGDTAVQGTYSGFRMIDIDDPDDPEVIVNWEDCASPTNTVGNQGDVIAWGRAGATARLDHPVVELADAGCRGRTSTIPEPRDPGRRSAAADPAGRVLRRLADVPRAGHAYPSRHPAATDRGQEGVHIIDVRDPEEPEVVGSSTRRAAHTPRRWFPTCATTAC